MERVPEKETPPAGQAGGEGSNEDRKRTDAPNIAPDAAPAKRKPLSPDPLAIRIALLSFHIAGPYPLSVLGDGPALGGSFPDIEHAVEWAVRQNRKGRNVYFSIAQLREGWELRPAPGKSEAETTFPRAKATKEDVASVCRLWVDVDPRAGEPLAAERERLAHLMGDGWPGDMPPPSRVIDSGGGFWAIFDLDEPVVIPDPADPGWAAAVASIEDRNRALSLRFGGDDCHNIERVCRLPGTINWPNEKKRKAGREKALSQVLYGEGSIPHYDLADFGTVADPQGDTPAASGRAATPVTAVPESGILIDDPRLSGLSARMRELIDDGRNPDNPDHVARYPSRSEAVCAVAMAMRGAGLSDEVMLGVLMNPDFGISMSILEKGRYAERAARRVIEFAHANADVRGGSPTTGGGPVLSTSPLDWARALRDGRFPRVLHFRGEFLDWDGAAYVHVPDDRVRADAWRFLETCQLRDGEDLKPFCPRKANVEEAVDALKAVGHMPDTRDEPPRWIDGRASPDPRDLLAVRNGLLDLTTGERLPPDPMFFTRNALAFDHDPSAPPPKRWLRFLAEAWPGEDERECAETLQEFMGYLLTPNTALQKALMIQGPKRSGKGTIGRVMAQLVGEANTVSPSLNSLGRGDFALQPLLAKQLAIVSDMKMSHRTDEAAVAETLLRITGEDRVSVNRKFMTAVEVTLPTRFVMFTNSIPKFSDGSDALVSRFLILPMRQSFFGREDPGLSAELAGELPGILNWAIEGWRRARARGRIEQPEAGRGEVELMTDLGSPMSAFVDEWCDLGPDLAVSKADLFRAFQSWHEGNLGTKYPGTLSVFARDLYAAMGGAVRGGRVRGGGERAKACLGIRLKPGKDRWDDIPF